MNRAIAHEDGTGSLHLGDRVYQVSAASLNEAMAELIAMASGEARRSGLELELTATAGEVKSTLTVLPDGKVLTAADSAAQRRTPRSAAAGRATPAARVRVRKTASRPPASPAVPEAPVSAPQPSITRLTAPARPAGRVVGLVAACLTGVLLAGGLGFLGVTTLNDDRGPSEAQRPAASSPTSAPTVYIPANVPPAWDQAALWAADIAEGTYPVVTAAGDVAHITPDHTVRVTDTATGATLLASPAVQRPSSLVTFVGPSPGVAWLADGELHAWTREGGEETYRAQPGAELYGGGDTPMLWREDSTTVTGLVDGHLAQATIPDGTTPLGIAGSTVVASAGSPPLWVAALDGGAPASVPMGKKDGDRVVRRWIGMEGDRLLIAWSVPGRPETTRVKLHNALTGKVIAAVNAPWSAIESAVLVGSADKRHPAVGPVFVADTTLLLARTPEVQALGTTAARYGLIGQTVGLVDDRGEWTAFPTGTKVPMGLGPNGEAVISVLGRVYALPRAK